MDVIIFYHHRILLSEEYYTKQKNKMVSVWQEKQRVWRIVAKTHHLKTLYIMAQM